MPAKNHKESEILQYLQGKKLTYCIFVDVSKKHDIPE